MTKKKQETLVPPEPELGPADREEEEWLAERAETRREKEVAAIIASQPATQSVRCKVCGNAVAKGGVCDVDGTREGT